MQRVRFLMQVPRIYLDMDGILADFTRGALSMHRQPNFYEENRDFRGRKAWDIDEKMFPGEKHLFWRDMDKRFWEYLPPCPWMGEVLNMSIDAVGQNNVYLCTSNSMNDGCVDGKRNWVKWFLPGGFEDRLILTRDKTPMAQPTSFLVDDREENYENFEAAGGFAHLFPAYWNSKYSLIEKGDAGVELALLSLQSSLDAWRGELGQFRKEWRDIQTTLYDAANFMRGGVFNS